MAQVAFLTANEGVEAIELTSPWSTLDQEGHELTLLAPSAGEVQLFSDLSVAGVRDADGEVGQAAVDGFDALVLPGGVANPDALRLDRAAVDFVRDFVRSGKTVAAICHAPWILIEAGVVAGRRLASWPSLQTDIRNAGGEWVDEQVVLDGNLITSRRPGDLDAFDEALLKAIAG